MPRRMTLDQDQARALELIDEGRNLKYIANALGWKSVQNAYERVRVLEKHGYVVRRGKKRWCVRWLSEKGIGVLDGYRLNPSYVRGPKMQLEKIVHLLERLNAKLFVSNNPENRQKLEDAAEAIFKMPAARKRRHIEALGHFPGFHLGSNNPHPKKGDFHCFGMNLDICFLRFLSFCILP